MNNFDVDIAIIGHFAKDKIVFGDKEEISPGGAVYYGGIALTKIGIKTAVITKLKAEDFYLLEELKKEGIKVFATPSQETSGIRNIYFTPDMDKRICIPLGFAGGFSLDDIPSIRPRIFVIGSIMAGEVNLSLIRELKKLAPVALDAQGVLRIREGDRLVFRDWEEKKEGLPMVDYLKVDSVEAEVMTGKTDFKEASIQLARFGPKEIVLTHAGGVIVHTDNEFFEAPFTSRYIKGRTGRGDTCFATYLARRLTSPPSEACKFAAAATSLKLENPGPLRATLDDILRLL